MRHRSEIGSVGFKHYSIKADYRQHIAQLGVLKSYNTVYSEIEIAYLPYSLDILSRSAKAVKHRLGQLLGRSKHIERIVQSVTAMYYHRQVAARSPIDLTGKHLPLLGPECLVPVKIHPYLSYSHVTCTRIKLTLNNVESLSPIFVHLGGDTGKSRMKTLHRLNGAYIDIRKQHVPHSGLERTCHCIVGILKFGKIQMCMSVYYHERRVSDALAMLTKNSRASPSRPALSSSDTASAA